MAESVIRGRKKGFTMIYNSVLKDPRLSLKTIGVFAIMQSFPDDWEYSISGLANRCRCGRDTMRKCLKELEDAGYLLKEQSHKADGKFACNTYTLQDEAQPCTEKPYTVTPSTDLPSTENRPQDKTIDKKDYNIPPIVPHECAACADPDALFERFWAAYPKKKDKPKARRAWRRLSPDLALCRIMSKALDAQKQSYDWTKDNGQFIPYPASWINGRRWEDEITPGPPGPGTPRASPGSSWAPDPEVQ